jgi:hypothetical protein
VNVPSAQGARFPCSCLWRSSAHSCRCPARAAFTCWIAPSLASAEVASRHALKTALRTLTASGSSGSSAGSARPSAKARLSRPPQNRGVLKGEGSSSGRDRNRPGRRGDRPYRESAAFSCSAWTSPATTSRLRWIPSLGRSVVVRQGPDLVLQVGQTRVRASARISISRCRTSS